MRWGLLDLAISVLLAASVLVAALVIGALIVPASLQYLTRRPDPCELETMDWRAADPNCA